MSSGSLRWGAPRVREARGEGGSAREGDGSTHMAGNPMLRRLSVRARAWGSPCSCGSEEQPEELKWNLHGVVVVAGIARGREGRRKRLHRRFGLVFGRGTSAYPTAEMLSGDVALHDVCIEWTSPPREQRGSRSVSDALSRRLLPSCAIARERVRRTHSHQGSPQCPQRKTRGAGVRAASTKCPQRRKTRARRRRRQ